MLNFLKKDFLVGMGAGFILSGIMIAYFGIGEPTDEEIRARATKLGMSLQASGDKASIQSGETANYVGKETVDTNSNDKENPADTPVSAGTSVSNKNSVSESANKVTNVIVEIKPGMGSETVARILEEKGVVANREEFYKVVTAKKAHSKFKVGKFSVPAGGDMEGILNILTGK